MQSLNNNNNNRNVRPAQQGISNLVRLKATNPEEESNILLSAYNQNQGMFSKVLSDSIWGSGNDEEVTITAAVTTGSPSNTNNNNDFQRATTIQQSERLSNNPHPSLEQILAAQNQNINLPDPYDSCRQENKKYTGNISTTKNGYTCQHWQAGIDPKITVIHKPNFRPKNENGDDGNHNYCRNPDDDVNGEWCYTTHPNVRYDYCDIPKCSDLTFDAEKLPNSIENMKLVIPEDEITDEQEINQVRTEIDVSPECLPRSDPTGLYYMGKLSKTVSGLSCQRWDVTEENAIHYPKYKPVNPTIHHNYCRNPDNDSNGLWCYTTDPEVRYEYCEKLEVCEVLQANLINVEIRNDNDNGNIPSDGNNDPFESDEGNSVITFGIAFLFYLVIFSSFFLFCSF